LSWIFGTLSQAQAIAKMFLTAKEEVEKISGNVNVKLALLKGFDEENDKVKLALILDNVPDDIERSAVLVAQLLGQEIEEIEIVQKKKKKPKPGG